MIEILEEILKDLPDDKIQVGMEMKTVANTLPNGQINYVFQSV